MDKSEWRGQNLLDKINNMAGWLFIVVILVGIFVSGRDFIWWAFGFLGGYGVLFYLLEREIKIRKLEKHGGSFIGEGNMDQAEGKGEEFTFHFKKFLKWQELSDYQKELVEDFLTDAQDKIEKLDKSQDIAENLVKKIAMESVKEIGFQEERD
ncbi:MAG: hypothetical protein ACTSSB_11365 [Candidatus Heimdallarchaeota archaeon]